MKRYRVTYREAGREMAATIAAESEEQAKIIFRRNYPRAAIVGVRAAK